MNQKKAGNLWQREAVNGLALSPTGLQQSLGIFLNPAMYTDTSNSMVQVREVKPDCHHMLFFFPLF